MCLTTWNVLVLVCKRTFHARHRVSARPASQDMVKPAVLRNRGNEYLHYEDDWYILAFKPDKYALIYYKGNNDAWQGYGGATVYTKCAAAHAPCRPAAAASAACVMLCLLSGSKHCEDLLCALERAWVLLMGSRMSG